MQFDSDIVKFSKDFLYIARTNKYAKTFKHHLEFLSQQELKHQLDNETKKAVFWVNIYNAFVQVLLKETPSLYKNLDKFHKDKNLVICNHKMSLKDIEVGIIRRCRPGMGNLFINSFEKEFRLDKKSFQPYIHFSLNSAAKSSPPIEIYSPNTFQKQLEHSTKAYLQKEAEYTKDKNIIVLPKFFQWYNADFGGRKGMTGFLQQQEIIPAAAKPKLRYKKFDWDIELNKFASEQYAL